MADMSVKQLADLVRTTPERLLEQLKDAGVAITHVDQTITDDQKRKLLLHLKTAHSPESEKLSKIVLKRKKLSVMKSGKKSVNVEIRSKRTYVKPVEEEKPAVKEAVSQEVPSPPPAVEPAAELEKENVEVATIEELPESKAKKTIKKTAAETKEKETAKKGPRKESRSRSRRFEEDT